MVVGGKRAASISATRAERWSSGTSPPMSDTDGARHILWEQPVRRRLLPLREDHRQRPRLHDRRGRPTWVPTARSAAPPYSATVPFGSYFWSPGQWVHLKTAWRNVGLNRLEIFVDEVKLGNSGTLFNPIGLSHGGDQLRRVPGHLPLGGTPASRAGSSMSRTSTAEQRPQPGTASATLASPRTLSEKLADPAKNYLLSLFATGIGVRRGQYLTSARTRSSGGAERGPGRADGGDGGGPRGGSTSTARPGPISSRASGSRT